MSVASRPALAVSALVRSDHGDVLLVQRGHAPNVGLWSLPGGRVEAGETLDDALVREVFQETSLQVAPLGVLNVIEEIGAKHHFVIVVKRAQLVGARRTPRAGDDATGAEWFKPTRIAETSVTKGLRELVATALTWPESTP